MHHQIPASNMPTQTFTSKVWLRWRWVQVAAAAMMASALAVCLVACGGGGGGGDKDPILGPPLLSVTPAIPNTPVTPTPTAPVTTPTVTATSPPNGTLTCVDIFTSSFILTASFSEPMDASTINTRTFVAISDDGFAAVGNVTYDAATQTAILTPTVQFSPARDYVATLKSGSAGIKSSKGVALANDYTWTFSTCD
jgi:Bacterial Ig-like domain